MEVISKGLLKVDPGLLLWTVITFFVLLLILWKTAWKPIVEALDSRAEKIRGDIESAERSRQEAEKIFSEHKEKMDNARNEALKLIEAGKQDAEKIKNEIIEKANIDSREMVARAKKEISIAKDGALLEIKKEIVNLSTEIASKIINKNLNPDDQSALIEEALTKMKTVQ